MRRFNAVIDKKADAGAAKHSVYDRVARTDPRLKNELKIIAESSQVPSNALAVRKNLDGLIKKKIKEALLAMDKDPEGKEVLKKSPKRIASSAKPGRLAPRAVQILDTGGSPRGNEDPTASC